MPTSVGVSQFARFTPKCMLSAPLHREKTIMLNLLATSVQECVQNKRLGKLPSRNILVQLSVQHIRRFG